MSDEPANDLHLPDLSIKNFRGIRSLSIRRLGRVTLLGGRNGVGKTTVLEAVRTYAARGSHAILRELLDKREEVAAASDEDHLPVVSPDYAALFHGRTATPELPITIGPNSDDDDLRIEMSKPADWSSEQVSLFADLPAEVDVRAVKVVYRHKERLVPWLRLADNPLTAWSRYPYRRKLERLQFAEEKWPVIDCESLGPGLPNNSKLATFWDNVALTEEESLSLQALRLTDDSVERVAVVGSEGRIFSRRVVVRLRNHSRPVPMKSLGDGVTRLFAAALALANSRKGFLVLDEAENGIHYSVQRDFWGMILRAAHKYNVQVLATTQSSDCVTGFARAAIEFDKAVGVYLRLERDGDQLRAIEYTEEELGTVADQGIEVR